MIPDEIQKCEGCDKLVPLRSDQFLKNACGQRLCNDCYAAIVLGLRMGVRQA